MTNEKNANLSEDDYLRKHLEGLENKSSDKNNISTPITQNHSDNTRSSDLHYFAFDAKQFPSGRFYPAGASIQVRAALVKEIQAYSMVDDKNLYDIVEKMNDMLASCVRIKYLDGTVASYLDIRESDRFYLIYLIRELTFQQGTTLTTKVKCSCGVENQVELKRENFIFHEMNSKIEKFFDPSEQAFKFTLKNNRQYKLGVPSIGLQKTFTEYIIKENAEGRKPNMSFLKVIPFLMYDKKNVKIDDIYAEIPKFEEMPDISFQFLNSAVEKISFGIKEVTKLCSCGLEVRTDMIFPDGPSALFVIHDAFDQFIQE